MRPGGLAITAGGTPAQDELAALAAALTALVESEARPVADPTPASYRSRWRRAATLEATEVPADIKHDGRPWGVQ